MVTIKIFINNTYYTSRDSRMVTVNIKQKLKAAFVTKGDMSKPMNQLSLASTWIIIVTKPAGTHPVFAPIKSNDLHLIPFYHPLPHP